MVTPTDEHRYLSFATPAAALLMYLATASPCTADQPTSAQAPSLAQTRVPNLPPAQPGAVMKTPDAAPSAPEPARAWPRLSPSEEAGAGGSAPHAVQAPARPAARSRQPEVTPGIAAVTDLSQCTVLAGSPYEPENLGTGRGVDLRNVIAWRAIRNCGRALAKAPGTPTLLYRLGRAYHAQHLSGEKPSRLDPLTAIYHGDFRSLYTQAAELGYAAAQYDLGRLHLDGVSTPKSVERAIHWFEKAAKQELPHAQYALAHLYFSGADVSQDSAKAFDWLRKAADNGLASAQYELAHAFETGRGLSRDDQEAALWYARAAKQGHPDAQLRLAALYKTGRGVDKNSRDEKRWLEEAASQGNQQAIAELAGSLDETQRARWREQLAKGIRKILGDGTRKDVAVGAQMVTEAAKAGSPEGQFTLAMLYAGEHGLPPDREQMMFWLKAAARRGYAPAQTSLGQLLWETAKNEKRNDRSEERYDEARAWLIKAAEQGHAYAQFQLGEKYISGVDGSFWIFGEAVKWLTKSAEQGFIPAQVSLGLRYWEGDFRTNTMRRDYAKAVHWLRLAADRGNATAKTYLGYAYKDGTGGLPKDAEAAVRLWREAAEKNDARAEQALGWAYENGVGVPRNLAEARRWYRQAAGRGSEAARRALETPAIAAIGNQQKVAAALVGVLALMFATAGDPTAAGPGFGETGTEFGTDDMCVQAGIATYSCHELIR